MHALLMFLLVLGVAAERPPNVLFILTDDLGVGDPGASNPSSRIPTPHIDRVAREGMRFVDAHSPSAVCTPSRYGLLTGRYPWRSRLKHGVLWGDDGALIENDRPTIARLLKRRGYHTACFGKWHLGLGTAPKIDWMETERLDAGPHTLGFDESLIFPSALDIPPYLYVRDGVREAAPTEYTPGSRRRWEGGGGFWRAGEMQPGFDIVDCQLRFQREAVRFLKARTDEPDTPWLLYFPMTAPHTPWVPADEFVGRSEAGWYGDFVVEIDSVVGALLEALEGSGQADNTIVVFTSDNGSHWRPTDIDRFGHDANLGWRGMKADIHEAGHRIPLYVRWPGRVEPGSMSRALVGLNDFYATLAEHLDLPLADGEAEDSVSFLGALSGGPGLRGELVHHSYEGMLALRQGNLKLCTELGSGGFTYPLTIRPEPDGPTGQLFDLAADPAERENLWLERPETVTRMLRRLAEIRDS